MRCRWARAVAAAAWISLGACDGDSGVARTTVGQWVWSRDDASVLARARTQRPDLRAAVWIGSLHRGPDGVTSQLGLPPAVVPDSMATLVIRLDDSLHPLVDSLAVDSLAALVAPRLRALLQLAEAGGGPHALQLDYDAPVRLLPRWAALLGVLRARQLAGREVWITSLLAHVEQRGYGAWFRTVTDGHVLQLFDTQVEYSPAMVAKVDRVIAAAAMPCAIGLGAFERTRPGGEVTEHRAWFAWASKASDAGHLKAVWIFAAGTAYLPLLASVKP